MYLKEITKNGKKYYLLYIYDKTKGWASCFINVKQFELLKQFLKVK